MYKISNDKKGLKSFLRTIEEFPDYSIIEMFEKKIIEQYLENMDVIDLLLMSLYSLRYPDAEDSLSEDEIDEALKIAIKKQKVYTK